MTESKRYQQTQHSIYEALPSGWRKVFTTDGRAYYQNDITKQTQWDQPTTNTVYTQQPNVDIDTNSTAAVGNVQHDPKTNICLTETVSNNDGNTSVPQNVSEQGNEDEYEDAAPKKLWDKEFLIWWFVFVISTYDYITDCFVVNSLLHYDFYCPRFGCNLFDLNEDYDEGFATVGYILLIASTIGFIAALLIKIYEIKQLYVIYKYPMKKNDEIMYELERYKIALSFGWIPIVFEDVMSLLLMLLVYSNVDEIESERDVYIQSIVVSTVSLIFGVVLGIRKRIKLQKQQRCEEYRKKYKCALFCQFCLMVTEVPMLVLAVVMTFMLSMEYHMPIVSLSSRVPRYNSTKTCMKTGEDADYQIHDHYYYFQFPEVVMMSNSMCNSSAYDYFYVRCDEQGEYHTDEVNALECTLYGKYPHWKDCGRIDCTFRIDVGFCGEFSVVCENGLEPFVDEMLEMYACLGYCQS